MTAAGSDHRIPELDGLRATAILVVVAWHYLGMQGGPDTFGWQVLAFGRAGVDLFFALSGFLITRILLKHTDATNYFSAFYGRRCFRILPIYGAVVGLWLLTKIGRMNDGDLPWWSYIIGVQNFFMAARQSYGAYSLSGTWSLAVEEQFYLVFPMIVLITPRKYFLPLLLSLIILCPIGRAICYSLDDRFGYYVLMPLRADILAVGAIVAWFEYSPPGPRVKAMFRATFWVTLLLMPAAVFAVGQNVSWAYWVHTYLVAFCGSALFMTVQNKGARELAFLRTGAAAFFARISYALYLVHGIVFANINGAFRNLPELVVILSFAISVLICMASYRFLEKPIIELGHRKYQYRPPAQNIAVASIARA